MVRIELGQSPTRIFGTAKAQVDGEGGGRRYGRIGKDHSKLLSYIFVKFPSEPETGFQPTSKCGSRKRFHNTRRGGDLPEHRE